MVGEKIKRLNHKELSMLKKLLHIFGYLTGIRLLLPDKRLGFISFIISIISVTLFLILLFLIPICQIFNVGIPVNKVHIALDIAPIFATVLVSVVFLSTFIGLMSL